MTFKWLVVSTFWLAVLKFCVRISAVRVVLACSYLCALFLSNSPTCFFASWKTVDQFFVSTCAQWMTATSQMFVNIIPCFFSLYVPSHLVATSPLIVLYVPWHRLGTSQLSGNMGPETDWWPVNYLSVWVRSMTGHQPIVCLHKDSLKGLMLK